MVVAGNSVLFAWNQEGRRDSVIGVDSVMFGNVDGAFEAFCMVLLLIVSYDKMSN